MFCFCGGWLELQSDDQIKIVGRNTRGCFTFVLMEEVFQVFFSVDQMLMILFFIQVRYSHWQQTLWCEVDHV